MPKLLGLTDEGRFNLTIALIGWVRSCETEGIVATVTSAAGHFSCTEKEIKRAVEAVNRFAPGLDHFADGVPFFDLDLYEDDGVLSMCQTDYLSEVPKLSARQGLALLTSLSYMSTFDEFKDDTELHELTKLLSANLDAPANLVELEPIKQDDDVAPIREAILAGKRIRCSYINQANVERERKLDPIRLDPRVDNWYLRAWCVDSGMVKNFRLDRMKAATVTDTDICQAARDAEAAEEQLYVASETDTDVVVEVDPEAYRLIAESNDAEALIMEKADKQGTVRATIKIGYLPNIGHLIARYGGAARVVSPPEAREFVAEFARNALHRQATTERESFE